MKETFPKRVRIIKLQGQADSPFPANLERKGWEKDPPEVGNRYCVLLDNGRIFRTGLIRKVSKEGFETENSQYRLEIIDKGTSILEDIEDTVDMTLVPQQVTIRCLDGSTIHGKVNIKHENRVSDLFIKGAEPFIVVFDASVKGALGKTLVLNKSTIAWVSLDE